MDKKSNQEIKILAAVVLYNETINKSDTINTLYENSPDYVSWYIINNGPEKMSLSSEFQAELFEDLTNPGLALAYKNVINYALENKFSHIMFLDQDTTFPNDFWEKQKAAIILNPEHSVYLPTVYGKRFMLSPSGFNNGRGRICIKEKLPSELNFNEYSFINSGALFLTDTISEIWEESITNLFLDKVDHAIGYFLSKANIKAVWYDVNIQQSYSGDNTSKEQILNRFKTEIKDSVVFGEISGTKFWQFVWTFRRRVKFCIKYFDIRFLFI